MFCFSDLIFERTFFLLFCFVLGCTSFVGSIHIHVKIYIDSSTISAHWASLLGRPSIVTSCQAVIICGFFLLHKVQFLPLRLLVVHTTSDSPKKHPMWSILIRQTVRELTIYSQNLDDLLLSIDWGGNVKSKFISDRMGPDSAALFDSLIFRRQ